MKNTKTHKYNYIKCYTLSDQVLQTTTKEKEQNLSFKIKYMIKNENKNISKDLYDPF